MLVKINYNKLVRDKIPQIIESEGRKPHYHKVEDDDKFLNYLDKKLLEESDEFTKTHDLQELADILEVIYTILELKRSSFEELEKIRYSKQQTRGGFNSRYILTKIEN